MMREQAVHLSRQQLALRLRELPGAFWLRDEDSLFVGAFPGGVSRAIDPEPDRPLVPGGGAFPRWVGVLPYETFRGWERHGEKGREAPLCEEPLWVYYPAVARVTGDEVTVLGESTLATERLFNALSLAPTTPGGSFSFQWAEREERGEHHARRIRAALSQIERGELYQVNLARRFVFRVAGHPIDVLRGLGPLGQAPFAAALDLGELQVVSSSPELFLHHRVDHSAITRPIKGTRPRCADPTRDAALAQALDESEKERAELAMVVDIERNDLGRLAQAGSVRMTVPPRIVSHPAVHHREATIHAQLRSHVTREELLTTLLPSGSVTGAPKVSAMELIAQLEPHRRGLYTGALGYLAQDGSLRLSMAIRVLSIKDGTAHYYAGGGIVADSDPEEEVEETQWKAAQLRKVLERRVH